MTKERIKSRIDTRPTDPHRRQKLIKGLKRDGREWDWFYLGTIKGLVPAEKE
jgi:hypothetical protein